MSPAGPRFERLKKRPEFLAAAAANRKFVAPGMIVQANTSAHETVRIGYTATKKLGNAVIRNRVKRRLRAVIQEMAAETIKPGTDLVLIGRQETLSRDFVSLCADLRAAVQKLQVAA